MSINKPGNGENPKEKQSIFGNISNRIRRAISPINDEEAWDNFPEEVKEEMLKSLEEENNFDLFSIDLSNLCINEPTREGDVSFFKEGAVQKDKIGNYIIINGIKCREYQPGISGFVYKDINDRYNRSSWLEIGFYNKGVLKKGIIINDWGGIPTLDLPNDVREELGGVFYETNNTILEGPLSNIEWHDIYINSSADGELNIRELTDKRYDPLTYKHSENWEKDDKGEKILKIGNCKFKPFEKGASGYVYKEFSDNDGSKIILAKYENGKMVGEGVVLSPSKKICVINRDKKNK